MAFVSQELAITLRHTRSAICRSISSFSARTLSSLSHSVKVEEVEIAVSGGTIAGRRWGSPSSKRRALALHGWLDNAATFDSLFPLILKPDDDFQIVAIDAPGHGKSFHRPRGSPISFTTDYLSYHMEVLQNLGWIPDLKTKKKTLAPHPFVLPEERKSPLPMKDSPDVPIDLPSKKKTSVSIVDDPLYPRVSLIGHSMGGAHCCMLASLFPENVDRLVMFDTLGPFFGRKEDDCLDHIRDNLLDRFELESKRSRVYSSFEEAVKARLGSSDIAPHTAQALVGRGTKKASSGGVMFSHDIRLRARYPVSLTVDQGLSFVRALHAPTLGIIASNGEKYRFPNWILDKQREALEYQLGERAKVVTIKGNHHLHSDQPELVAALVRAHLLSSAP